MKDRKAELFNMIEYHNKLYWIDNDPKISDIEYDNLVKEYIKLGGKLEDFKFNTRLSLTKYIHKIPMLSLDKAYSHDEIIKWCQKVCRSKDEIILIQPKFDGWAGKLIFIDNKFKLVTRGDGKIGEDISNKLEIIQLPEFKDIKSNTFIIGEIILSNINFNKYKNQILRDNNQPYKSPRSALAGLLGSKEIKYKFNNKILEFLPYAYSSTAKFFKDLENIHDFNKLVDNIKQIYKSYPMDGIVFKLADTEYYNSLGNTSHHPYGAIAFKFGNPSGISKLINVEWFIGKNNTINPVGIIQPVVIAGHEIRRVNLHNAQMMIDKQLHINDEVVIERCGEIIPDVVEVKPSVNRKPIILNQCPCCGSNIKYEPPFLYCTNLNCSGSLSKRLIDSCVRLGIDNIGKGTINKLIDIGIADIYDILTIDKEILYELPGFAEISVNNLYNEIQKVVNNEIEDWKILSCLNINGFGDELSRSILTIYTFDELLNCNIDDFIKIPGLSEIRAYNLLIGLDDNNELLINLLNLLKVKITKNNKSIIDQKTICFTGKMPNPRSYYEKLAENKGYHPINSVTKDLDILVTSEIDRKSSKINKAKKLNIKIITLDEFLNL